MPVRGFVAQILIDDDLEHDGMLGWVYPAYRPTNNRPNLQVIDGALGIPTEDMEYSKELEVWLFELLAMIEEIPHSNSRNNFNLILFPGIIVNSWNNEGPSWFRYEARKELKPEEQPAWDIDVLRPGLIEAAKKDKQTLPLEQYTAGILFAKIQLQPPEGYNARRDRNDRCRELGLGSDGSRKLQSEVQEISMAGLAIDRTGYISDNLVNTTYLCIPISDKEAGIRKAVDECHLDDLRMVTTQEWKDLSRNPLIHMMKKTEYGPTDQKVAAYLIGLDLFDCDDAVVASSKYFFGNFFFVMTYVALLKKVKNPTETYDYIVYKFTSGQQALSFLFFTHKDYPEFYDNLHKSGHDMTVYFHQVGWPEPLYFLENNGYCEYNPSHIRRLKHAVDEDDVEFLRNCEKKDFATHCTYRFEHCLKNKMTQGSGDLLIYAVSDRKHPGVIAELLKGPVDIEQAFVEVLHRSELDEACTEVAMMLVRAKPDMNPDTVFMSIVMSLADDENVIDFIKRLPKGILQKTTLDLTQICKVYELEKTGAFLTAQ
jgi:hypothetical protein